MPVAGDYITCFISRRCMTMILSSAETTDDDPLGLLSLLLLLLLFVGQMSSGSRFEKSGAKWPVAVYCTESGARLGSELSRAELTLAENCFDSGGLWKGHCLQTAANDT